MLSLRGGPSASVAVAVVVLALNLHAQQTTVVRPAQPQAPAATETGTSAITGAVFDAVTGRPVAGAIVALEERTPGSPRRTYSQVTTPTGRFAFIDLPAGETYLLSASKPGYLDGGFGRRDPRGPSAPLALTDGQWLRDVKVTLPRPGSISGSVVDERGEPVVGAYVRVLSQALVAGRTQWLAGVATTTDDRGAYRIPGLGPGKYLVSMPSVQATFPVGSAIKLPTAAAGTSSADLRASSDANRAEKLLVDAGNGQQRVVGRHVVPPPPTVEGHPTAYPIAFYPGASTPAEAAPVELRTSEDRSGINLQLHPVRATRVSGVVQGPAEAVGHRLLRLIPVGLEELGQGSEAATTVTLADGGFTFLNVPAGAYLLETRNAMLELTHTSTSSPATAVPAPVSFPAQSAAGGGVTAASPGVQYHSLLDWRTEKFWGQLQVTVTGQPIDDVALRLQRPVTVSGRVEWAPNAKPLLNRPDLVLEPADGRPSLAILAEIDARPGADFTIEGLMAGGYVLRARFNSALVESVTWNGQDYTERPFDAGAGRDFTGVVVRLANNSSSVAGTVSDVGTTGAAVIAFPVERERWANYGFNPARLKSVLASQDGRFRLDGLPVGDYYLVAVPAAQERAWIDPAFLNAHAGRATRVRVDRSDSKVTGVSLAMIK